MVTLAAGSAITQGRELARAFSHKPAVVLYDREARKFTHSGPYRRGFLYRIAEKLTADDIKTPESSALGPGEEWITVRELKLELDDPTEIADSKMITGCGLKKLHDEGGIDPETYRIIVENRTLPE